MKRPEIEESVARRCHWQPDGPSVVRLLPELALTGFRMESWTLGADGAQWILPMTGISRLAGVILETLEQAKVSGAESFLRADIDVVRADGLVSLLCTLFADHPPERASQITVGVYAVSSRLLSADGRKPSWLDPTIARRSAVLLDYLNRLVFEERTAALGQMSDAVSARVAATFKLLGLQTDGLSRRAIANRLVWVLPHTSTPPDLSVAAALLKSPLDRDIVRTIEEISGVAQAAAAERLGRRSERLADALVDRLLVRSGMQPLLDVEGGADWVRALPHLIDARALKGAVSDAKLAARYLEPTAVRSVAGAWSDLVRGLGMWDILGSLGALVLPVHRTDKGWVIDENVAADSERWSLSLPREEPRRVFTVVAARFSEVLKSGPEARQLVVARWQELVGEHQAAAWIADHGVAVFNRSREAADFALTVNESFVGRDGFLRVGKASVSMQPGIRVPVGMSTGQITGGRSGDRVEVGGPPVGAAMHFAGYGPLRTVLHDPLQIRRVSGSEVGLESEGVAMSRDVMTLLMNEWGAPVHRHGDGSSVAGVSGDVVGYPVEGWAAQGEGAVVFIGVGRNRGASVVEATRMTGHALKDLAARDVQLNEGLRGNETMVLEPENTGGENPFDLSTAPEVPEEKTEPSLRDSWTDLGFGDDDNG